MYDNNCQCGSKREEQEKLGMEAVDQEPARVADRGSERLEACRAIVLRHSRTAKRRPAVQRHYSFHQEREST